MNQEFQNLYDDLNKHVEKLSNLKILIDTTLEDEKKDRDNIVEMIKTISMNGTDIIVFNLSGTRFETYFSTISKRIRKLDSIESADDYYSPNLLQSLASGMVQNEKRDKNEPIFIDRNPKHFNEILDYLRTANTDEIFEPPTNVWKLNALINEAKYFKIQGLVDLVSQTCLDTNILTKIQVKKLILLCEFERDSKWKLIYRGSRDGFGSEQFHGKCDGILKTMIIVKSTDFSIFGGYTDLYWDQTCTHKDDKFAFLFSLLNKKNEPVKLKYNVKDQGVSITGSSQYLISFGAGPDLFIANNANVNKKSYSNLGHTFSHPKYTADLTEAKELLAGSYNFQIFEIEVFCKV